MGKQAEDTGHEGPEFGSHICLFWISNSFSREAEVKETQCYFISFFWPSLLRAGIFGGASHAKQVLCQFTAG